MWTRSELKGNAKTVLKSSYWYGVLAVLIAMLIGGFSNLLVKIISFLLSGSSKSIGLITYLKSMKDVSANYCYSILALILNIFVVFPLSVGVLYYFMRNRESGKNEEISNVFYAFSKKNYSKVVGAMAWVFLFTFLWFLIPVAGIVFIVIKGIAYSMTAFILTDNVNIGYRRALKLSIAMTDGYKGKIFVLGLSFIGWGILATIPVGLGWFFLAPYINATYSELYAKLRENSLNKGICTYEELNLTAQAPAVPAETIGTGNAQ